MNYQNKLFFIVIIINFVVVDSVFACSPCFFTNIIAELFNKSAKTEKRTFNLEQQFISIFSVDHSPLLTGPESYMGFDSYAISISRPAMRNALTILVWAMCKECGPNAFINIRKNLSGLDKAPIDFINHHVSEIIALQKGLHLFSEMIIYLYMNTSTNSIDMVMRITQAYNIAPEHPHYKLEVMIKPCWTLLRGNVHCDYWDNQFRHTQEPWLLLFQDIISRLQRMCGFIDRLLYLINKGMPAERIIDILCQASQLYANPCASLSEFFISTESTKFLGL
ncbi:MAG: hypothetical protein US49_C0001G0139 [candidate division TM6 bacterium GW2011_GWF2_37_49]|nr:MAG: hypothetical protein US49_C0001G0139 [candidate division TM6 bacterium GW2011_GWF2_37_49]